MSEHGYAHPEMLAETAWLAQQMESSDLRIVDARPATSYLLSHIPGAVNIPIPWGYLKDPQHPAFIMGPEAFKALMEQAGIGDDAQVIAYDDDGGHHAARLWWALEYYGHPGAVRLLNGGWDKWTAEGRPTTTLRPTTPQVTFTPRPNPQVLATPEQVQAAITTPGVFLLDVRSRGEYQGTDRRDNRYGGHIPGAVHLEWVNAVTPDGLKSWKSPQELRAIYEGAGIQPGQKVITY
jgi:thiosulfate/3-mercaptopyruvate sulfurtransferase